MPFKLSPMQESDIPAFALADEAANKDWLFAQAMQVPGVPRHVFVEEWTRQDWGKNDKLHWLKVSETETGDFVAAALWSIPATVAGVKNEEVAAAAAADASAAGGQPPVDTKDADQRPPPPGNAAFFAVMKKEFEEFMEEHIGDQEYVNLNILMTDPKYQRQGAGSMLVRWGCDRADELNMIASLTASAAGLKVYTNHGFEVKKVTEMDLRPFGFEGTELRRRMIRQPRTGAHLG